MDVAKVEATLKGELSWLQKHERLVLCVIAGLVLWFGIGKIDTLIANHDNANLQQAKVAAAVQQEKNDTLAKQVAQDKAEYEALAAKIEARDAQLQALQVQLVTALAKQQQADKTMTPTELTQRWNMLVPEAGAAVAPSGAVELPTEGARATVIELEKAPVLQKELDAKGEQLSNALKLVAAEGQQVTDRDTLITGLKKQAVLDAGVCQDTIKTVKDEARKSKRHWFYAGFVVGFVSREAIKFYTGF
jgi:hypothetical protein